MVGVLLLIAAAGKSALVPFSGWLPRAMEGPTPSSAVFYGALSVHLGAFLLLRASPLLEASFWLSAAVVALGLTTALFAYLAGSVQTDIKSALSFASLSQVGLIVAEIGLGLRLRRAGPPARPRLPADAPVHSGADLAARLPPPGECPRQSPAAGRGTMGRLGQQRFRAWLYRFALERGYLDTLLADYVVAPFLCLFRRCDRLERRWTDFLAGRTRGEASPEKSATEPVEELS